MTAVNINANIPTRVGSVLVNATVPGPGSPASAQEKKDKNNKNETPMSTGDVALRAGIEVVSNTLTVAGALGALAVFGLL